ncbi:MAG TPA: hypothetical protein VF796_25075 [Humisphaera sp.]
MTNVQRQHTADRSGPDAATAAAYQYIEGELRGGTSDTEIAFALVQQGWHPQVAQQMIADTAAQLLGGVPAASAPSEPPVPRKPKKDLSGAYAAMAIGGCVCLLGLLITGFTYVMATQVDGGNKVFIAWGAVIFGGFTFLKGLADFAAAKSPPKKEKAQ